MKRRGYISIFALLTGLLLFTIITFMVLSIRSHNQITSHQLIMEQVKLKGESVAAFLLKDQMRMKFFADLLKETEKNDGYFTYSIPSLGLYDLKINYQVLSEKELRLFYDISEKGLKINYNFHLLGQELPLPIIDQEDTPRLYNFQETEDLLNQLKLEDFQKIEENTVIFSREENIYKIEEAQYKVLLEKYKDSENKDGLWTELVEASESIEKPVYFNGESLIFAGEEEVEIEGIGVDRGNIAYLAKTNWKGIYFNYQNNSKDNLVLSGKLFGEDIRFYEEKAEVLETYKGFFFRDKELVFYTSYIY